MPPHRYAEPQIVYTLSRSKQEQEQEQEQEQLQTEVQRNAEWSRNKSQSWSRERGEEAGVTVRDQEGSFLCPSLLCELDLKNSRASRET